MAQSPGSFEFVSHEDVRQGFLCPICFHDLKTVEQLQEHFDVAHSAEDEAPVLQTLKGLFGKAKRKILKLDTDSEEACRTYEAQTSYSGISPFQESEYLALNQEFGAFTSHTTIFKELRYVKINRYVIETNKLLIRLDRLITDAPEDPEKRKAHEKSIVPWVADADVPLCPGCAKSFGLSRRRHHCRLCGGVMCNSCSQFIDFNFARNLTLPALQNSEATSLVPLHSRRGSNVSLLSVVNLAGEPQIRCCRDCIGLLIRRHELVEQSNQRPAITQKYERMKDYMAEVEKLVPLYIQMIDSLGAGETKYHLQDAQEVKVKISKMAEGVDTLSKIIAKLPSQGETICHKAIQLQNTIRLATTQFLKRTVLGLPNLPTAEEVESYKRCREEEIQKRIQLEKMAELQKSAKNLTLDRPNHYDQRLQISGNQRQNESKSPVSVDDGWTASAGAIVDEEENPMLQQINIIHKYIKQARLDHRYDEVHMLEANLKELQIEYMKQQQNSFT